MVYAIFKVWIRISLWFFTKKIIIGKPHFLSEKGPLLLACNHPNSFLDAILLGVFMNQPVHFITRGDVFKNNQVRKFLESLHMIPIFRLRDGKDKLVQNDEAFVKSVEALRKNELLLIFVEGFCENQTELQLPLKKGAPRILQSCWQQNIPASVLPLWLQYSSYNRFGKTIEIQFGSTFDSAVVEGASPAAGILKINAETEKQLLALSASVSPVVVPSLLQRIVLFLPAMLGAVLHAPLYLPLHSLDKRINGTNVHFDSILLAMLSFLYPVYLVIISSVVYFATGLPIVWLLLVILPILAKSYVLWKK